MNTRYRCASTPARSATLLDPTDLGPKPSQVIYTASNYPSGPRRYAPYTLSGDDGIGGSIKVLRSIANADRDLEEVLDDLASALLTKETAL